MFSKFELTNKGVELLNRVIAEQKTLKFTKFQIGKGDFSGDKKTLTQLVSKIDEFNVSQTNVLADGITNIKGFYDNRNLSVASKLTEIGIMAQLGDDSLTEVLFSYSNQPSAEAETIPAKESYFSRTFSVMNRTDNVTSVTFNLTIRQDKYNFGTLAEMKAADYLDVGDKVTLWGNETLGDSPLTLYIITDQVQSIQLNNKLYAKAYNAFVNDLTTGGADKALSGEMGKKIWTDRNKTNTYTASNNKGVYYGELQGNYDGVRLALQRKDSGATEFIGMAIGGTTGNTGLTSPIFRQRVSNDVGELLNNTFELFHQGNYDKNKLMLGNMGIDSLIYIQDGVIKEAGKGYVDKTTGKLYYCYKTTTPSITTTNKDYFVLATNIELKKLFEPKTHKVSFFGVQELEFTRIGNVVYVFMQYTTKISSIPNNSKVNEGNLLPAEFRPKQNTQWILQGNSSQGDTYIGSIAVLTDGLIEIYTRNSAILSNAGVSTLATYLVE